MADGSVPDITQQLLQMQSMIASANGGGKVSPVLAALLPGAGRDVDVFTGLSLKGKGLNGDKTLMLTAQGKPRLADKMFQAIAGMSEDFKKMAQNAGVMYTGDLPSGSLPGGGMSGGSSFADGLGPRGGGYDGIA